MFRLRSLALPLAAPFAFAFLITVHPAQAKTPAAKGYEVFSTSQKHGHSPS